MYGQDFGPDGQPVPLTNGNGVTNGDSHTVAVGIPGCKIDVEGVVELYEHYIIPLTKEVEVSLRLIMVARVTYGSFR